MEKDITLEYAAFLRSFKRNIDVPHSFLLGAGASISSGVQSAYDCIWEWKKDIFLSKNVNSSEYYKNFKDNAVRKSIQKWLDNEGGYPILDSPQEYSFYAENDTQNETFKDHLSNYHIDKNMIVIGYSGRDKSLMDALKETFTKKGSGRLYWCGYGETINSEVSELLLTIRASGREAYYVATDGFDKTMIHLSKSAFEDNPIISLQIDETLKDISENELHNTDFTLNVTKTDKYIKSNLHPIIFPKEVFQFEIDYGNEKPWSFLRMLTKETNTCAIPFKKKVFALGTLSEINATFKNYLRSDIKREAISKKDIENVGAFRALMLQAVLKYFTHDPNIESDNKDKLWMKSSERNIGNISIHKALSLSLFFSNNNDYAYLSFSPTVYLTSPEEIGIKKKQEISKKLLEKLYNNKYDEYLSLWNTLLFENKRLKFEYPLCSGTGFEFQISCNSAYGEINVLDSNFRTYSLPSFDKRKAPFKGVQFLEPQLVFRSKVNDNESRDYHPMRGLTSNRPYDVILNGRIYSNEINLSVICGQKYSNAFYSFLSQLQTKHFTGNINPDYLIDYPGFTSIFNIPINVPYFEDKDNWYNLDFQNDNNLEAHKNALQLARLITSKIDQIANTHTQSTIVIFIPEEWRTFESYIYKGESFDLHDYIKAFAASRGISTQLIREDTLNDSLKCQIYWWLSLSFYVKSFRTPWILNNQEKNTAYAGIGYSISKILDKPEIVIGCSHIYDSNGQGLKYKLSKIDDYYLDKHSNPYLSYNDAFQFGVSIRELFYQSLDKLPERVVIHKRTKFTEDEINGIKTSLNKAGIHRIDLIEINYESDARFLAMRVDNQAQMLQADGFPISRGTCILTNKNSALLWTHGIVPSVRQNNYKFYLGGRSIPAPLKITKHYGDSNINTIASEILGLTKMNWNSFDLYSKLPSTIDSSNQIARIGKLLSRFEGKTYDYRLFI